MDTSKHYERDIMVLYLEDSSASSFDGPTKAQNSATTFSPTESPVLDTASRIQGEDVSEFKDSSSSTPLDNCFASSGVSECSSRFTISKPPDAIASAIWSTTPDCTASGLMTATVICFAIVSNLSTEPNEC